MSSAAAESIVPAKKAAENAVNYVRDLGSMFPYFGSARLEEIELLDDGPEWDITVSFKQGVLGDDWISKRFRIDALTGQVLSMKNRSVDDAS